MAFIRQKRAKNGKVYYQLCESFRDEATGKVRQRVIKHLGASDQECREAIAKSKEIIEAIQKYPDIVRNSTGQAILAEYKRRELPPIATPSKKYRTIILDPPWPVEKILRTVRPKQYDFDYPVLNIDEIKKLPIPSYALADGCHLYLWTTHRFLPDAFDLLQFWGFNYVFTMVWHKTGGFQPYNLPQYNCEFVLFGRLNGLKFNTTKDFNCCFPGQRREHSRKPDDFYELIRRVSPEPRIDWFSREPREGFEQYGNEPEHFA